MAILAKLSRPRLAGVHPISRLFRRLDQARRAGAVWISGPPGSGKTTLAASYLRARRLKAVWYKVDEGDRDVASFFHYLALAVERAAPRGKPLPACSPEYGPAPGPFARHFFRAAWSRLGRRVLVLDDYQEARSPSPLDELIRAAVSELPEGGCVLVASREPPPSPLARLLANGGVAWLAPAELRLTARESLALARARGARKLSGAEVERLDRAAGGWAAGLVLLLASDRAGESSQRPGRGTPQELFDYFANEVFDGFPDAARKVLLETALLPRVPAAAAAQLTGIANTRSVLSDLARGGYFVARLDQREEVYEYHPLFRSFLLERGRAVLEPERIRALQLEAGRLLASSGDPEDAVDLLRAAGAFEELARLVVERAPELLRDGRWEKLSQWIGLLPAELREGQPWVAYWLGQSRLPVSPRDARAHLERAFHLFLAEGDAAGSYLSWAGVTQSYIFEWGDFAPLDRWIEAFEELRRRWPTAPAPEIEAAAVGGMFTALVYRQPDHPEMASWRERARAVALGSADIRLRRPVAFTLSQFAYSELDPDEASAILDAVAPPPDAASSDPASVMQHVAARGMVEAYRCRPVEGLCALQEGLALARSLGLRFWEPVMHLGAVTAHLALDDVERARASLRAMDESLDRTLRANEACYETLASVVMVRTGDLGRALRHAERALELARACGAPFWVGMAEVARAVARAAADDSRDAEAYARSGPPSHPGEMLGTVCASSAAALSLRRGDEDLAAELLAAPFPAEERGAARFHFLWVGRADAAELCALALERGIGPESARSIIRAQRLPAPERAGPSWPWPVRIFTLGCFEVEIDGETLRFDGKAKRKPLELLQALVALGPGDVAEGDLVEALWPDAEGDAGQHALETTAYRLRKLLRMPDLVEQRGRRLSLDRGRCWVDVEAIGKCLRRAAARSSTPPDAGRLLALVEEGVALYRGPFLPGEDERPWVLAHRERTRRATRRLVALGAGALDAAGREAEARALERRAAEGDPELLGGPELASA